MIPGANLLNLAHSLIGFEVVSWSAFASMTTNDSGAPVATYAAPADIKGSVQAVPRSMFTTWNLDFNKEYVMFFTAQKLSDLRRASKPDLIDWDGSRFQVESNTNWHRMDGWQASVLVRIGETPTP